ncbi:MAG: LytTR family DNA-binding domain-containing protein [Polaribacter sp.]|nr:LytTR family DNA-binding domain-containing protein [Polaribacter sp.]
MNFFFSWLKRPYFFNHSIKYRLIVPFASGLFVFLFLCVFKPFRLVELHGNNFVFYSFGVGVIVVGVFFITLFIFPILFKGYFNPDRWTVGKSIMIVAISLALNGFFARLYSLSSKTEGVPTESLSVFLLYSIAIGTLPAILLCVVDERVTRKKREKIALRINKGSSEIKDPPKPGTTISLKSENNKEELIVLISDLVYLTSEGNYVSVFLKKEGGLKEAVLRTTLTKTTIDLNAYKNMVRCHKSYVVNTNYIKKIHGNARGYVLKSPIIPFEIPVSRGFPKGSLKILVNNS